MKNYRKIITTKEITREELIELLREERYNGLHVLSDLITFLERALKGSINYKIGYKVLLNNLSIIRDRLNEVEEEMGDDL